MKTEITPDAIINARKKKVFCGDCRHFHELDGGMVMIRRLFSIDRQSEFCHHPSNVIEKHDTVRSWKESELSPNEKNASNDCPHFSHKNFWKRIFQRWGAK